MVDQYTSDGFLITDAIAPDTSGQPSSAPSGGLLNSIFNTGLGLFQTSTNAATAQKNAKANAQIAAAHAASTQRLIILAVVGIVIVGIVFALARRK